MIQGLKLAFVGDGCNNITHSLSLACTRLGMDFSVASPKTAMMSREIAEKSKAEAVVSGSVFTETNDPFEAVNGADIVYTDTFVSMGDEDRKEDLMKQFDGFQVDTKMMSAAKPDALYMHDMPAYRGIEVTPEVIDGPQSIIYDQAENRQHAQKATVLYLMGVDV